MNLAMSETAVLDRCRTAEIGVSAIEPLPSGGVRLVCMSSSGAERMRSLLRSKVITGEVTREKIRPSRPLW